MTSGFRFDPASEPSRREAIASGAMIAGLAAAPAFAFDGEIGAVRDHVQSVTGPVRIAELGKTLMHEHIMISNPGAEYDPRQALDRPALVELAVRRLRELRDLGISTFVDPCPVELGRDVTILKEVSEKSGMTIICATGFYTEARGLPWYFRQAPVEEIAAFLVNEIEKGIGETGIRPGLIKAASGAPAISALEEKFLTAAAIAQRTTGVPILTHTDAGLCGPEQQDIFGRSGVKMHRCMIGHSCGSSDPEYHARITGRGSYIGFDRIGIPFHQSDETRARSIAKLIGRGYQAHILMSQDRFCINRGARRSAEGTRWAAEMQAKGHWPPPYSYLFTDFFPLLHAQGVGDEVIASMLSNNPQRFFSGAPLPSLATD